jgi:hypothetical protein
MQLGKPDKQAASFRKQKQAIQDRQERAIQVAAATVTVAVARPERGLGDVEPITDSAARQRKCCPISKTAKPLLLYCRLLGSCWITLFLQQVLLSK